MAGLKTKVIMIKWRVKNDFTSETRGFIFSPAHAHLNRTKKQFRFITLPSIHSLTLPILIIVFVLRFGLIWIRLRKSINIPLNLNLAKLRISLIFLINEEADA